MMRGTHQLLLWKPQRSASLKQNDSIRQQTTPSGMTRPVTETENTGSKDFTSYINGIVGGTDMHIMLDTGSTISFISEQTKMSIPSLAKRPIKKKFIMSQAVTGQSLDTLGMVDVTFKLGSQTLRHEVQVIGNVNEGFILGCDFLTPQWYFRHGEGAVLSR